MLWVGRWWIENSVMYFVFRNKCIKKKKGLFFHLLPLNPCNFFHCSFFSPQQPNSSFKWTYHLSHVYFLPVHPLSLHKYSLPPYCLLFWKQASFCMRSTMQTNFLCSLYSAACSYWFLWKLKKSRQFWFIVRFTQSIWVYDFTAHRKHIIIIRL